MGAVPSHWFSRHGGLLLYGSGLMMALAGVALENQAAVKTVLILLGGGLILVGVLLPRLSGTLEISPTSVKIPIASLVERLETTRREAQVRAPDRVEEAVGRAYQLLAPFVATEQATRPVPPEPRTPNDGYGQAGQPSRAVCPSCGHGNTAEQQFCASCGQFLGFEGRQVAKPGSAPPPLRPAGARPASSAPVGRPHAPGARRAGRRDAAHQAQTSGSAPGAIGDELPEILRQSPAEFADRVLRELEAKR